MHFRSICSIVVVLIWPISASSPSSSASGRSRGKDDGEEEKDFPLIGMRPNPLVAGAPLIVGAVCSDGVVMLAAHPLFAEEPLLSGEYGLKSPSHDEDPKEGEDEVGLEGTDKSSEPSWDLDLPPGYGGPFRISSVDSFGTCMSCAGWRADGEAMVRQARNLAAEELFIYGEPPHSDYSYGDLLASELSSWMDSGNSRPLGCAALLACSGAQGGLWLVDVTGAFPMRACALGGGAALGSMVNKKLADLDCAKLSMEDCIKTIVSFVTGKGDAEDDGENAIDNTENPKADTEEDTKAVLPEGTRFEIVFVQSGYSRRSSRRMSSASLFGISKKRS